jgi:hypothetical protein
MLKAKNKTQKQKVEGKKEKTQKPRLKAKKQKPKN